MGRWSGRARPGIGTGCSSALSSPLTVTTVPPNQRLKLTGGDRSKGNGVLCAGAHELSFNDGCARRASRPQLKRDPLGGARVLLGIKSGTIGRTERGEER